jgi:glycosyltransferase involved in cell wall biosynthesis
LHFRRIHHTIVAPSFCGSNLNDPGLSQPLEAELCESLDDAASAHSQICEPYLLTADYGASEAEIKLLLAVFQQVRLTCGDLQLVILCRRVPAVEILESVGRCGLLIDQYVLFIPDARLLQQLSARAELAIALGVEGECRWIVPAMASGLQVVCTSRGCAAQVVGCAGKVVDRQDPIEIAHSIALLLKSGDRHQRADVARRQAERFNWRATVDDTIEIYKSLVNEAGQSRLLARRKPADPRLH